MRHVLDFAPKSYFYEVLKHGYEDEWNALALHPRTPKDILDRVWEEGWKEANKYKGFPVNNNVLAICSRKDMARRKPVKLLLADTKLPYHYIESLAKNPGLTTAQLLKITKMNDREGWYHRVHAPFFRADFPGYLPGLVPKGIKFHKGSRKVMQSITENCKLHSEGHHCQVCLSMPYALKQLEEYAG